MIEVILVAGYVFLFIFLIKKLPFFQIKELPRYFIPSVFVLKVLSGISLGLIFTYHYTVRNTGDTFKFFNDSKIIFDSLFTNPSDFYRMLTGIGGSAPELRHYYESMDAWLNADMVLNDNRTIIRLNTLFRFFSLGLYYVHVVFINMMSLIGLIHLYKVFAGRLKGNYLLMAVATFLLPSVMYWGSGLLKEGLLLFALGVFIGNVDKGIRKGFSGKIILITLLSGILLILVKIYVIGIIFPAIFCWIISERKTKRFKIISFSLAYAFFFLGLMIIPQQITGLSAAEIMYWKQKNFYNIAELGKANSLIEIPRLDKTDKSLLINAPAAFFITLTRPFLFDIKGNFLILIAALENLLILSSLAFLAIKMKFTKKLTSFNIFCLIYTILMFSLIGLTAPVLGAMVRYKVPVLPFLFFIFLYYSNVSFFSQKKEIEP